MNYQVIARTKAGHLAYEFSVSLSEIDTHELYQSLKNDTRYTLQLIPS